LRDGNYSSAAVLQNLNAHKELHATYYIKSLYHLSTLAYYITKEHTF